MTGLMLFVLIATTGATLTWLCLLTQSGYPLLGYVVGAVTTAIVVELH